MHYYHDNAEDNFDDKKVDLLLHPVGMRIIQQLLLGKPLTIAKLLDVIDDVPQATSAPRQDSIGYFYLNHD
jgi:hypothetical protein